MAAAPGSSAKDTDDGSEPLIEPALPIVDAHHHLWFRSESLLDALGKSDSISTRALLPTFRRHARYLFDEYLADINTGHQIDASVFVDAHVMYKAGGPPALQSVGEVEFANGVAAMGASGNFGRARVCAGIIGNVDLTAGDAAKPILEAHVRAGNGRYRGVRALIAHDPDPDIFAAGWNKPHVLLDERFRAGFRHLHTLGLSFDAFLLEPQLPDLIDLARAFPETVIVLNHLGTPVGIGRHAGRRNERFPIWRDNMRALARCENVSVKLSGIGMHFAGFDYDSEAPVSSARLAADWAPYIQTCIETFGVARCMFGSNFPVDSATCGYRVLWNAFKRVTQSSSMDDKTALYRATATRVYRLDLC